MDRIKRFSIVLLGIATGCIQPIAQGGPTGEQVVSGDISVTRPTTEYTHVEQTTDRGLINWQEFNIDAPEHVHFDQPSESSMTLNRVIGGNTSSILGKLTAIGQLMLINRAGLLFGENAKVDVSGLIATTADISTQDFMSGNYQFEQKEGPGGNITQKGHIKAKDGGYVILVAPHVTNTGIIEANLGKVGLSSGTKYLIDLTGDGLIHFELHPLDLGQPVDTQGNVVSKGVFQEGKIIAHGGKVLLSAEAAHHAIANVTNREGIIEADTIGHHQGEIVLSAGEGNTVNVSGKLTARGTQPGEKGGTVKILGETVNIGQDAPAEIDVSGQAGGGTVLIGGNYRGQGPEPNAKETLVTSQTQIKASATQKGDGGTIVVWSDDKTGFHGTAEAKGGLAGGSGGLVETSGKKLDVMGAKVDTRAPQGETGLWLLDPEVAVIVDDMGLCFGECLYTDEELSTALENATTDITIEADKVYFGQPGFSNAPHISWSTDTVLSILANETIYLIEGTHITNTGGGRLILRPDYDNNALYDSTGYDGTVRFLRNILIPETTGFNDINIDVPYTELFYIPETYASPMDFSPVFSSSFTAYMLVNDLGTPTSVRGLQAIRLNLAGDYYLTQNIDASDTSSWNSNAGFEPIGNESTPFTGSFLGNDHAITGLYIDRPSSTTVGLFGATDSSTISGLSLENTDITGGDTTGFVGGLIGRMNSGTLSGVSNTGIVSGTGTYTGGLVGQMNSDAVLQNAYNQSAVFGDTYTGGLVGEMTDGTTLQNAYHAGLVSGGTNVGGLVGGVQGSVDIRDSFWDIDTSGQLTSAGSGTGLTTAQMMQQSNYTNWDFTSPDALWNILEDESYPYFAWRHLTTPQVVSGMSPVIEKPIDFLVNGVLKSSVYSGANTFYYHLLESGTYGGDDMLLAYTNQFRSPTKGTTVYKASNADSVKLDIDEDVVKVLGEDVSLTSDLSTAKGALGSGDVLYDVTGHDLTVNSGVKLQVGGDTTLPTTVQLVDDTTVTADQSEFDATVDGSHSLDIEGNVVFNEAVGSHTELDALSVTGESSIGNDITTTWDQEYQGAVTLTDNVALDTGTGIDFGSSLTLEGDAELTGTHIGFGSTINGGHDLNISGNATFGGIVGGTTALNSLAVSGISEIAHDITTTGNQNYGGNVTLTNNVALNTAADIDFGSTVDGEYALDISGNATFGGMVGDSAALNSLLVSGASEIAYDITTSGKQEYTGPVVLTGDVGLMSIANKNIKFGSTVNGAHSLDVLSGSANFGGIVGGSEALTSLFVTGVSTISNNITTINDQEYQGAVTLTDNVALTTGTDIDFWSTVTLEGDAELTGTHINFWSTINGGHALNISGNAAFGGIVGNDEALSSLLVSGESLIRNDIITTGNQNYSGAVTLARDNIDLSGDQIVFHSTVDSDSSARDLDIHALTDVIFEGNVGGTNPLKSLDLYAGSSSIHLNGGLIQTLGAQHYYAPVKLGSHMILTSTTGGDIVFHDTLDSLITPYSLSVNTIGNTIFHNLVGSTLPLFGLETDTGGTTIIYAPGIATTTGGQIYHDAVILKPSSVMLNSQGNVEFHNTLGSDSSPRSALFIDAAGVTRFKDTVGGGGNELSSLTTTGGGHTEINTSNITTQNNQLYDETVILGKTANLTGDQIEFGSSLLGSAHDLDIHGQAIFGGLVTLKSLDVDDIASIADEIQTIGGHQNYTGAVTLIGDAQLTGDEVFFGSTVNSDYSGAYDLSIMGNVEFSNIVGGMGHSLGSLFVSGTSDFATNANQVNTSGPQTYTGLVTIDNDMFFQGSQVEFGSTINDSSPHNLVIEGNAIFGDIINPGVFDLLSVSGTSEIADDITTSDLQFYGGPVTLTGDVTLESNAIEMNSGASINSDGTPRALTVNALGSPAIFGNSIGNISPLQSLNINAPVGIKLSADEIHTLGEQIYNGDVQFTRDMILTSGLVGGTAIDFQGTLNSFGGSHNLTLNTPGNIIFGDHVGDVTPLNAIHILNAHDVINWGDMYTHSFVQDTGTGTTYLSGDDFGFKFPNRPNITGLHATGDVWIRTLERLTGNIYANKLHFWTQNFADLKSGTINGKTGEDAALDVALSMLGYFGPGTHFYDKFDLYPNFRPPHLFTPPAHEQQEDALPEQMYRDLSQERLESLGITIVPEQQAAGECDPETQDCTVT